MGIHGATRMPALKTNLLAKLNEQIANELGAAHQYLAMSAWFEAEDLPGCAQWMRTQAEEERGHAMKFYGHINERDGKVMLQAIVAPATTFKGPVDVFQHALEHEQKVTSQIYELYAAAQKSQDYALQVFLNWFITEQVEEENTVAHIVSRFERLGDDATGIMLLDKEMASRAESE